MQSNIIMHIPKSQTFDTHPTFTNPYVHTMVFFFHSSSDFSKYHRYTVDQWNDLSLRAKKFSVSNECLSLFLWWHLLDMLQLHR